MNPAQLRLLAPAKINLHLRVGPPDDSGFHPLVSWMTTVGLFDTLTIERAAGGGGLSFTCDDPGIGPDEQNLVVRAARALVHAASHSIDGTAIALAKRIPAGGGLGGGSSDAARTLLGLNQFWKLGRSVDELSRIAETLGSDVPFFLRGPSSICTGRGQFVQPIAPPAARWAAVFLPGFGIETAKVYRRFDELRCGDEWNDAPPPWQTWATRSAAALLADLRNDLEPAAFDVVPALRELHVALETALGRVIRMSGSGSTLFSLFDTREEAVSAADTATQRLGIASHAVEIAPRIVDDLRQSSATM